MAKVATTAIIVEKVSCFGNCLIIPGAQIDMHTWMHADFTLLRMLAYHRFCMMVYMFPSEF